MLPLLRIAFATGCCSGCRSHIIRVREWRWVRWQRGITHCPAVPQQVQHVGSPPKCTSTLPDLWTGRTASSAAQGGEWVCALGFRRGGLQGWGL